MHHTLLIYILFDFHVQKTFAHLRHKMYLSEDILQLGCSHQLINNTYERHNKQL
jgi:hypothetical protein